MESNITYEEVRGLYNRVIIDRKEMRNFYEKKIKDKTTDNSVYVDLFEKGIIRRSEVREYLKKKYSEECMDWLTEEGDICADEEALCTE